MIWKGWGCWEGMKKGALLHLYSSEFQCTVSVRNRWWWGKILVSNAGALNFPWNVLPRQVISFIAPVLAETQTCSIMSAWIMKIPLITVRRKSYQCNLNGLYWLSAVLHLWNCSVDGSMLTHPSSPSRSVSFACDSPVVSKRYLVF